MLRTIRSLRRTDNLDAVTEPAENRVRLKLEGATAKVEVDGALGIVAKVLVDGERAAPKRGGWAIPTREGDERLAVKGLMPGFQSFIWRGKVVHKLGGHVGLPEKITLFSPALLVILIWWTVPIALALFFMGVPIVKNPQMPRLLRILLPLINTVAVFFAVIAVVTMLR